MSKPAMKDRVTGMVRDVLGPSMKAAGFRRTGRVFWRNMPEVCHVATVAMSRWGSDDESSFDVQLGVFWHRVEGILENPSIGKMPPPANRCTFQIDLGRTISMLPKPSWTVTRATDLKAVGQEVLSDLRKYGFRWFEYRSALNRSLEWKRYSTPEGNGCYSMQELVTPDAQVVFKVMLGMKKDALADLKRFVENGHAEMAVNLAKRLQLPTKDVLSK